MLFIAFFPQMGKHRLYCEFSLPILGQQMYHLHIANKNYSSWSLRPWLLMTELDIEFTEIMNPFEENGSWHKFRKFSPSGLVPCLNHQKSKTLDEINVWDSLAITEYLAEHDKRVWPENITARAWARSATAEMHSGFPALRNYCPMNCGLRIQFNEQPAALNKDISRLEELWQQGFNNFGGPFLAGDKFTAVDAFYAPVIFRLQTYGLKVNEVATSYMEHMLVRKPMQTWYDEALAEEWRDIAHEEEIAESSTIIKDLRNR